MDPNSCMGDSVQFDLIHLIGRKSLHLEKKLDWLDKISISRVFQLIHVFSDTSIISGQSDTQKVKEWLRLNVEGKAF